MSVSSSDRREDIVRLLTDTPDGLSDGDLARALGAGVRPGSVNTLCRRLAAAGVVERVGTRPIRNRLVPGAAGHDPAVDADDRPGGAEVGPVHPRPLLSEQDCTESTLAAGPSEDAVPDDPAPEPTVDGDRAAAPVRDVLQAWSRTVNVQAAVASWLCGRGASIRSATLDGTAPARDLVARLDGHDVHVEVTGWPPDGDRTHPNTIAADWFAAAARAAARRLRRHPHARIVIAVPDTRRYRALAAGLAGSQAEVWFVYPSGSVEAPLVGWPPRRSGTTRSTATRSEGPTQCPPTSPR